MPQSQPSLRPIELLKNDGHCLIDLPALLASRDTPLPKSLMIVAENLARQILNGAQLHRSLDAVLSWTAESDELTVPLDATRVMFPDSSGLPALMDLAAARDAVVKLGGEPGDINPLRPVTLVVDHSLIVDLAGHPNAEKHNVALEYKRNGERYAFFKWAEHAFENLSVVPPGSGIIHQVHLEKLAKVVTEYKTPYGPVIGPEFVLGCDSHTTMVNGLGLLAWGVGGLDGEAAALGQQYFVRIPKVVGVRLSGKLPAGTTTTDLVLTVTQRLRQFGVVGAFVEFYGPGIASLSVPERATISNMAPEYGATVGYFPMDAQTIAYLRQSGRTESHIDLVKSYIEASGMLSANESDAVYSETIEIDLAQVCPSVAGPKRPQDRIPLRDLKLKFDDLLTAAVSDGGFGLSPTESETTVRYNSESLTHGALTIAAITSCTNTSNPSVMIGAGLLARNAVAKGLRTPDWVKTSLAPGSRLVADYLADAGLMLPLEKLGFHVVGFGCTTCSGKSGAIDSDLAQKIRDAGLVAASVLSGNRNFEGRIHKSARANFLASPPLVVAFALAGRIDIDFEVDSLGEGPNGEPVFLGDIWPEPSELAELVSRSAQPEQFRKSYATLFDGSELWDRLEAPKGPLFQWNDLSTYVKRPPFFDTAQTVLPDEIYGGRVLVKCGDSLTTDHITPSGEILEASEAGKYLLDAGVTPKDFNAVTQRRGNHEFMVRVTFSNQRTKNDLAAGYEGGFTRVRADGEVVSIHNAAEKMCGTPLLVLAGKDYGMGSSRDWAAKGPSLLGVRVVLAESFERIHRANLIAVGIMPLTYECNETAENLSLTGFETYEITGIHAAMRSGSSVKVRAVCGDKVKTFGAQIDIASDYEAALLRNGGIFLNLLKNTNLDAPSQGDRIA